MRKVVREKNFCSRAPGAVHQLPDRRLSYQQRYSTRAARICLAAGLHQVVWKALLFGHTLDRLSRVYS